MDQPVPSTPASPAPPAAAAAPHNGEQAPHIAEDARHNAVDAPRDANVDPAGGAEQTEAASGAEPEVAEPRVAPLVDDDDEGDVAFSEELDPATKSFGAPTPVPPSCQWCHAVLPVADAARCPSCGAILQPIEGIEDVPGLTTMSDAARAALERVEMRRRQAASEAPAVRPAFPSAVGAAAVEPPSPRAYEPPPDEVRAAMLQIELETAAADRLRDVDPAPLRERTEELDAAS